MARVLVVATHNAKKGVEMTTILGARFPQLVVNTLADYPGAPEPEETGQTYEDNAVIKAISALEATNEWCVSDDAGLEIDALPGQLGVYSKRFAGEETPFPEKIQIILGALEGLPVDQRKARFRCWVALARPGQSVETFEGICEGTIGLEPKGAYGFGYDPIFIPNGQIRAFAEIPPAEKHTISHRGKVLRKLSDRLAELL